MKAGITAAQLHRLRDLIAAGDSWRFYSWGSWRGPEGIRAEVLKLDHNQCYFCGKPLNNGRLAIVHHVQHLDDAPELALSIWAPDGTRQLVTCCKDCHELQHPEALSSRAGGHPEPATVERWD